MQKITSNSCILMHHLLKVFYEIAPISLYKICIPLVMKRKTLLCATMTIVSHDVDTHCKE